MDQVTRNACERKAQILAHQKTTAYLQSLLMDDDVDENLRTVVQLALIIQDEERVHKAMSR